MNTLAVWYASPEAQHATAGLRRPHLFEMRLTLYMAVDNKNDLIPEEY